jgi:hypothetical protein
MKYVKSNRNILGTPFYEILRRVALIRTEVSEQRIDFIIRVTKISELGKNLAVIATEAHSPRLESP